MGSIAEDITRLLKLGVKVHVNGYEIESETDLEKNYIREDACCMRDYIWNEEGEFIEVNFDVIRGNK